MRQPIHRGLPAINFCICSTREKFSCLLFAESAAGRAMTTRSTPASCPRWQRKLSRTSRFRRLRPTARRICFFEIARPSREPGWPVRKANIVKYASLDRSGFTKTRLNSGAASRRAERGNAFFLMNQALKVDVFLRNQARAALRTACVQHFAAAARGHPGAKTMGSSALYAAGLKSTFHDRFSEQLILMSRHFVPARPSQ